MSMRNGRSYQPWLTLSIYIGRNTDWTVVCIPLVDGRSPWSCGVNLDPNAPLSIRPIRFEKIVILISSVRKSEQGWVLLHNVKEPDQEMIPGGGGWGGSECEGGGRWRGGRRRWGGGRWRWGVKRERGWRGGSPHDRLFVRLRQKWVLFYSGLRNGIEKCHFWDFKGSLTLTTASDVITSVFYFISILCKTRGAKKMRKTDRENINNKKEWERKWSWIEGSDHVWCVPHSQLWTRSSPQISHSMKNLAFQSSLIWDMILSILTTWLTHFPLKGSENIPWRWRLTKL